MISFKDAVGREVILKNIPQKIISFVPSYTLSLFDLQIGHLLAGRTKFCNHPSEHVRNIPICGGTKNIRSVEFISELSPDLILCNLEENAPEMVSELEKIAPVWVSEIKNGADSLAFVLKLGQLTGAEEAANQWKEKYLQQKSLLPEIERYKKCLYFIWQHPWMVAGGDTYIHEMLSLAGMDNCMKEVMRYPEVAEQQIVEYRPDYILLSSEPYPFSEKHVEEFSLKFPFAKVMLVNGETFSWHGTRMLQSIEELAEFQRRLTV